MVKRMIVATTGNFALCCLVTNQEIEAFRPSVIRPSAFFSSRMGLGQINILVDNLPEIASDEEFAKTLKACDGDVELAISSYVEEVQALYEAEEDDTDSLAAQEAAEKEAAEKEAAEKEAAEKEAAEKAAAEQEAKDAAAKEAAEKEAADAAAKEAAEKAAAEATQKPAKAKAKAE